MEDFWMQIPPRSIIDEFIAGDGTATNPGEGRPASHLRKQRSRSILTGTELCPRVKFTRLRADAPQLAAGSFTSSKGPTVVPVHHDMTERHILPVVL